MARVLEPSPTSLQERKDMVEDHWADNRGIHLHYLDTQRTWDPARIPMVFVPGLLGTADDYQSEVTHLFPRRCVALSLRGRGKSDAPERGYSLEDHVSDIETVLASAGLNRFCLMGYSTGVAYALGYAVKHPSHLAGLVIGDYPARYPAYGAQWVERVRGHLPAERYHVAQAIHAEGREVLLWDSLPVLRCPVLILRGGQEGSLLPSELADEYLKRLLDARVNVLEKSGHALWEPDVEPFLTMLDVFLTEVDKKPKSR